jgi:hypothetical protein
MIKPKQKYFHKPQTQTLNERGLAHLVVPLAVVMAVAVGGAFWVVASNANSMPAKKTAVSAPSKKRIKPTLHLKMVSVTPTTYNVDISLRDAKVTVPPQACSGTVKLTLTDKKGKSYTEESAAYWAENACRFQFFKEKVSFAKGSVKVRVEYKGNTYYKPVVRTKAVKQESDSGGCYGPLC